MHSQTRTQPSSTPSGILESAPGNSTRRADGGCRPTRPSTRSPLDHLPLTSWPAGIARLLRTPPLQTRKRRAYAWLPWHGCNSGACETIFNDLFDGVRLRNVLRIAGVGRLGGMEQRTCRLINETTSFTCWYVDPALAQGHPAFRSPGFGPSPVTAPFYVYARNGREYRHWLMPDTGYAVEVSASKPLAANARTSLSWSGSPMLCDLVTARGTCDPLPPSGKLVRFQQALGAFQPVVGDYNGDALTDIIWYSASGGDAMWRAAGNANFVGVAVSTARRTYTPLVGDYNGDGRDDVFWYSPTAGDTVWYGQPGGFTSVGANIAGAFTPLVGDYNGDGYDDVIWYSPTGSDAVWYGRPSGFTVAGVSASGAYTPLVADYSGDGFDDVLWYSPIGGDAVWYGRPNGFVGVGVSAVGTHAPFVGDFNGDDFADVFWYSAAAGGRDWCWPSPEASPGPEITRPAHIGLSWSTSTAMVGTTSSGTQRGQPETPSGGALQRVSSAKASRFGGRTNPSSDATTSWGAATFCGMWVTSLPTPFGTAESVGWARRLSLRGRPQSSRL